MAIKTYNDQNFVAIANAIRAKNGETTQYKPSEMAPAIMAIESGLELLPQDTVVGAIANFPDGSDGYPVVELIANIDPKQSGSGDPSPSNVRPISGATECNISKQGKNLLENQLETQTVNGTTFTINSDKSITVSGTPSAQTRVYLSRQVYTVLAASYMSFGTMPTGTRVFCTRTAGGSTTYPTISNTHSASTIGSTYTNFLLEINTTFDGTEFTLYPQIELGSSGTEYKPYQAPEVKTISWESEAGTVYSGTLNVTTGELTVTHGIFSPRDNSPASFIPGTNNNGYRISYRLSGALTPNYLNLKSNVLKSGSVLNSASWLPYYCCIFTDNNLYITVGNEYNTSEKAHNYLVTLDTVIIFELATPQTYQLDPEEVKTLLGVNNIYADTGDVEVTYRADIDLYIAKKIAEGA